MYLLGPSCCAAGLGCWIPKTLPLLEWALKAPHQWTLFCKGACPSCEICLYADYAIFCPHVKLVGLQLAVGVKSHVPHATTSLPLEMATV